MSDQGPLPKQIAASIEDVKVLLDDNRHLSIAFLSRRIQDVERDVRERFRTLDGSRDQRVASLEDAVQKLRERLQLAGVKFKEMREELDQMKGKLDSVSPSGSTGV
jgi:chromosome segregation ATPase